MAFFIKQNENWYLKDTAIENIFINEYMTEAPGDYVKAYLLAMMHAQIQKELTDEEIAKVLKIEEEDVRKAWNYWESKGLITKKKGESRLHYDVEFLSLKGAFIAGTSDKIYEEKVSPLEDEEISGLYLAIEQLLARPISPAEMRAVESWLCDMDADPEVIMYAYDYGHKKGKDGHKYIGAIVKNWTELGLRCASDVEEYMEESDERHYMCKRIMKSLGFNRNWTEKEKAIMDSWFDEMGFTIDRILQACGKSSGISNPNFNYVNKVLLGWHEESLKEEGTPYEGAGKKISMNNVFRYYEYIREKAISEAEERKNEVYSKVPRIAEIQNELKENSMKVTKAMLSKDFAAVENLKKKIDDSTVERAFMLTENNFPPDYMEVKYKCDLCEDTGINQDGEKCQCFAQRMEEAIKWHTK